MNGRLIAALLVATCALGAHATELGQDPAAVAFAYECENIDPSTGIECRYPGKGELLITWREEHSRMTGERRRRAEYEFSRLLVRYFDLGGRKFRVSWKPGVTEVCTSLRDTHYQYRCGVPHS